MTRVDAHCYNSFVIHGDPSGCMMCKFELDYIYLHLDTIYLMNLDHLNLGAGATLYSGRFVRFAISNARPIAVFSTWVYRIIVHLLKAMQLWL